MKSRKLLTLVSLAAAFGLTACAHSTTPYADGSQVNRAWGSATDVTRVDQTANPDAPTTDAGPEGLDASTGERVADRYYRGQESQQTRRARAVVIGD